MSQTGCTLEVLTSTALRMASEVDPATWLGTQGWTTEVTTLTPSPETSAARWPHPFSHLKIEADGIPVGLLRGPSARPHVPDESEVKAFSFLVDAAIERFQPDVLIVHGCRRMSIEGLRRGIARGVATALWIEEYKLVDPSVFSLASAVVVASQFLADYIHELGGPSCRILPPAVDFERVRSEVSGPRFAAFPTPSPPGGLAVFVRIAVELSRRRPDIPLLMTSEPEGKPALDGYGRDLWRLGNIHQMASPADARRFWDRTRVALLPIFDWACSPRWAIEAQCHGIPVLASDRGSLPEALGDSGLLFPLPDRLTPATSTLPTADEVTPWVEAIIRIWDDPDFEAEHRNRAWKEARRWSPETARPQYLEFLESLRSGNKPPQRGPRRRTKSVVLVPHLNGIEPDCEESLHKLERAELRVVRRRGSSQIDLARSEMASDALHDRYESILFIDADIGFDPADALRILARPEPVISGVYAKKGRREMASTFADGVDEVLFGPDAPGPYPLKYAATGFLRVRDDVLRRMIEKLNLPICNLKWCRGTWPFFLPLIIPHEAGGGHYLGEDWAFSHRLGQIGIIPLADTTIRLWHYGSYGYSWEDAGADHPRYRHYRFRP